MSDPRRTAPTHRLLAVVAIASVVAVTACGSSGKVTASPATTAPATTAAPATTTAPSTPTTAPKPTTTTTTVPRTTTTKAPEKGTRTNPFDLNKGDLLVVAGEWAHVELSSIEDVDPALIQKANQFNDPAADGQKYVRIHFSGLYDGSDTQSGSSAAYEFSLVGDKSKLYSRASVSDAHNVLDDVSDQSDVITGGTLEGFIYYTVDADDTNLLCARSGKGGVQFIVPLAA